VAEAPNVGQGDGGLSLFGRGRRLQGRSTDVTGGKFEARIPARGKENVVGVSRELANTSVGIPAFDGYLIAEVQGPPRTRTRIVAARGPVIHRRLPGSPLQFGSASLPRLHGREARRR
jgi:hypothetical protein